MNIQKLPFTNLVRKPARTATLILLTALLALSVFGGSMVVMSLRSGLKSLESRLGADIIVVPSSAQSKVSFRNMLPNFGLPLRENSMNARTVCPAWKRFMDRLTGNLLKYMTMG